MNNRNGKRNRGLSLPTHGMKTERQSLIRHARLIIRRTKKQLRSIGYPFLMKTVIRKRGSEKERDANTFGKRSIFRKMTGTIMQTRNDGVPPGQNIATDILHRKNGSITVPTSGRVSIWNRRSMKGLPHGRLKRKENGLTVARRTGKSASETSYEDI